MMPIRVEIGRCPYLFPAVFGEARWSVNPIGTDILDNLERKAKLVDWRKGDRKEYFVLFSRSGFTESLKRKTGERQDLLLWGK